MSVAAQKMRDELGWSESQKGLILVFALMIWSFDGVHYHLTSSFVWFS